MALEQLQKRKAALGRELEEVERQLREESDESGRRLPEPTKRRLVVLRACDEKIEESEAGEG